ncbi:MAG: DNA-binding response regulator [Aggregatilineales bacterium]
MDLRVLIAADNLLARVGLAAILENQPQLVVVGQVEPDEHLQDNLDIYQADILLLDVAWSDAQKRARFTWLSESDVPILVLLADETMLRDVLNLLRPAAPYGVLLRDTDPDTLALSLQTIAAGQIVLDPLLMDTLLEDSLSVIEPLTETLTNRENEVLQLLADGLTNKGIAQELGITAHTVKFHVNAIMGKTGAQSRTEAVVRATRAGLLVL